MPCSRALLWVITVFLFLMAWHRENRISGVSHWWPRLRKQWKAVALVRLLKRSVILVTAAEGNRKWERMGKKCCVKKHAKGSANVNLRLGVNWALARDEMSTSFISVIFSIQTSVIPSPKYLLTSYRTTWRTLRTPKQALCATMLTFLKEFPDDD